MRSQRKTFILSLIIASIAFGGMFLYDYLSGNIFEAPRSSLSKRKILIESVRKISEIWRSGKWDRRAADSCPQYFSPDENYSREFLQCNSHYLYCLFKDRPLKNKKNRVDVLFQSPEFLKPKDFYMLGPTSHIGPYVKDNGLFLSLSFENQATSIRLRSDCHSLYLPQNEYAQTLSPREEPYRWSNKGRDIFFDKFLVRKRDVLEFYEQTGNPKAKDLQKLSMKQLSLPSDSLLEDQMRDYCAYQGKSLMKAHIFDALFYHPGPEEADHERMLFQSRSPYPWTWRKGDSYREKILKGETSEVTMEDCKNLFSLECKMFQNKIDLFHTGLSWAGAYMGLGVIAEFSENSLEPRKNVTLSSSDLSITSPWHELGQRAYWNGKDHDRKSFSWGYEHFPSRIQEIPVGFRCMREVF